MTLRPSCFLKLIESVDELTQLNIDLKANYERNYMICSSIEMRLMHGLLPDYPLRVYRATEEGLTSFVFVTPIGTADSMGNFSTVWDSKKISYETLGQLFSNVPNFDWNRNFYLRFGNFDIKAQFIEAWGEKKVTANTVEMIQHLSFPDRRPKLTFRPDNLKIPDKLPSGYTIKKLTPASATTILSTWKFNVLESLSGLETRLSKIIGFGVYFYNETNGTEELVSWTQQYVSGLIGMTFTLPGHRNKGLATVVLLTLVQHILDEGREPYLFVEDDISLKFHLAIGFEVAGQYSGLAVFTKSQLS